MKIAQLEDAAVETPSTRPSLTPIMIWNSLSRPPKHSDESHLSPSVSHLASVQSSHNTQYTVGDALLLHSAARRMQADGHLRIE